VPPSVGAGMQNGFLNFLPMRAIPFYSCACLHSVVMVGAECRLNYWLAASRFHRFLGQKMGKIITCQAECVVEFNHTARLKHVIVKYHTLFGAAMSEPDALSPTCRCSRRAWQPGAGGGPSARSRWRRGLLSARAPYADTELPPGTDVRWWRRSTGSWGETPRTAQGQRSGAPFELCYSSQALVTTRIGYQVPYIDRPDAGEREELDAGARQHLGGERGRHHGDTACFTSSRSWR
jgi:hypothetical protein